ERLAIPKLSKYQTYIILLFILSMPMRPPVEEICSFFRMLRLRVSTGLGVILRPWAGSILDLFKVNNLMRSRSRVVNQLVNSFCEKLLKYLVSYSLFSFKSLAVAVIDILILGSKTV